MKRCLQLAKNGLGKTYPNPLVGCVLVWDKKIIGEGWHQRAGAPHAEVNAITDVKNPELLKDATLYVNLEPCSHYGKTPPCSQLIIAKRIPRVVVGITDPNPKVAGRGIQQLKDAGIKVERGCLAEEAAQINKRFLTFQTQKRPYIILKWAQTADGFIAPERQEQGKPFWITNSYSKQRVHQWRSKEQAILVGKNTAIKDNPRLNTRLWNGKSPLRILIDKNLEILNHPESYLLDRKTETLVFCQTPAVSVENLSFEKLDFTAPTIPQLLEKLYLKNIQSLIVEGGRDTVQRFIDQGYWDEARVFTGTPYLRSGIKAPNLPCLPKKNIKIQNDQLHIFYHD